MVLFLFSTAALLAITAFATPLDLAESQLAPRQFDDLCSATICYNSTVCGIQDTDRTLGVCLPTTRNPCTPTSCPAPGSRCVVINGQPVCTRPQLDCSNVLCILGTRCVMINGRPTCIPAETSPCDNYICRVGERCVVLNGRPFCLGEPVVLNPCSLIRCRSGSVCRVIDGRARCIPIVNPDPCANHVCPERGSRCVVVNGRPVCLTPVPDPCSVTLCRYGSVCKVIDGRAQCVSTTDPCANHVCPRGAHCVVFNGRPTCISPQLDNCSTVDCRDGHVCRMIDGRPQCILLPMLEQLQDPALRAERCGWNVCPKGQKCCNESCGICAPPDGMCTLQYCLPVECGEITCPGGMKCCGESETCIAPGEVCPS